MKVINHALAGIGTDDLCKAFVDALGLKTLFNAFMSKVYNISAATGECSLTPLGGQAG